MCWVLRTQKLRYPPHKVGTWGYQRFLLVKSDIYIEYSLAWRARVSRYCRPSRFILLHISKTSPNKDCEMSGTMKRLTCRLMNCVPPWYNNIVENKLEHNAHHFLASLRFVANLLQEAAMYWLTWKQQINYRENNFFLSTADNSTYSHIHTNGWLHKGQRTVNT